MRGGQNGQSPANKHRQGDKNKHKTTHLFYSFDKDRLLLSP